jgi:hypothetical protein
LRDAKGEKKMDASQAAFINHVDNWKHCRMYLDGGAVNFDQQQHLVRKKEAAIPKNDAGLVASRSACLARLWRLLLPFAEDGTAFCCSSMRKIVAPWLPYLATLLNSSLLSFHRGQSPRCML